MFDPAALELLERVGPFCTDAYRVALADAIPGWHDASVGLRLADGARAALALAANGRTAESLPYGYGGIAAERELTAAEVLSILSVARVAARARSLSVRTPALSSVATAGGTLLGTTSVVFLDPLEDPASRFAKKALQSIRRADRAGGFVTPTSDPDSFLRLYEDASASWAQRYPAALIRRLARDGIALFFDCEICGDIVASAVALRAGGHWMYWLAAQRPDARRTEVGYLVVAALLGAAHLEGVDAVNLGASAGLDGVAAFKRRFGATEIPIFEWRIQTPLARAVASVRQPADRWRARLRLRARLRPSVGRVP